MTMNAKERLMEKYFHSELNAQEIVNMIKQKRLSIDLNEYEAEILMESLTLDFINNVLTVEDLIDIYIGL